MRNLGIKCIGFLLAVFTYTTLAGTVSRRQYITDDSDPLYLYPAPRILPGPSIDPAPVVLNAGSVDRAPLVEPAGAIEPAPQIAPAPAILPSNAIREKDRAYPQEKRFAIQNPATPKQALEEAIITAQQIWKNGMNGSLPQTQNSLRKTQQKPDQGAKQEGGKAVVVIEETVPREKNSKQFEQTMGQKTLFAKGLLNHPIYRKGNDTAKFKILKKNGAILIPGKIYAPTPFHFKLDRKNKLTTTTASSASTSPTKASARAKANKETKKMKKTKEKCTGVAYRPGLQGTVRVVPTQTGFIQKGPNSKQVNKAPMQKPYTKPTKKMSPQILAGCSMEPEKINTQSPTKSSKVKQTLFIPNIALPQRKTKDGRKFKTKQTFHIQQIDDNGRARHLKLTNKKGKNSKNKKKDDPKMENFKIQKKLINTKSLSQNESNNKKRFHFHATFKKEKGNQKGKFNVQQNYMVKKSSVRKYKTRDRRQLMLPYTGLTSEQLINPLAQQLVSSLSPAQPVLSQPQNILEPFLAGQSEQPLLSQPSLVDRQTSLFSPLLQQQGLTTSLPLLQQQQQQPFQQTVLPLSFSQPLPDQTGLSSVPMVANPAVQNSQMSYQSPLTQTYLPIASPRSEPGETRQAIPEVNEEYSMEEEYPRRGRRRHHHRRGYSRRSRMRQNPYEYDTYRSFENTYGKSPGIFDDLKDISSEMGRYIDDDDYRDDEGRRHRHHFRGRSHHSRHRRPSYQEYREYKDYDSDGRLREDEENDDDVYRSQKQYASPEETEEPGLNPGVPDAPLVNTERQPVETPVETPAADPVIDAKEDASLHDAEESTENAVKDANIRKEKAKENELNVVLKDDTDDETEETQAKRSELVKHLEQEAVMHLDFDEEGAHKKNIVKDQSNNNNDATLSNGAAVTTKNLGTCGRGVILKKGEVSYNGTYFKRKPTKEVSISMWVKSNNPGFIRWFYQSGSSSKSFFASTKSPAVSKKRWTHLVGTFDTKTGVARIYVNGKLKLEKVGKKNDGLPQDFTSTGIGRKFGDSHVKFLDDVYMFDRVISPEEVTALYKKCEFNRMILHYGFQHWNGTTHRLDDQSGLQNNATIKGGAHVRASGCDKCGACLDLQSDEAEVYLNSSKYRRKPKSAVSISAWINLNRTSGLHSIFQALKDDNKNLYNLEVTNGKVHWQSKDKKGDIIFDALTNEVTIPEGLWSHVTGTYSSKTGNARIYVNGLLRASFHNQGGPRLSTDWSRASIGGHFPDKKPFNGLLDEFFMYNWELDPSEVVFVSKYCADKPKLVSFTVKVPIL